MNNLVVSKTKAPASIIFFAIAAKLINAPFSSGDFESELGRLINQCFDGIFLAGVIIGAVNLYRDYLAIYVAALVSGVSYALATMIYTDESMVSWVDNHLKVYLPLLAFPVLLKSCVNYREWFLKRVKNLCVLIAILLIAGLVFLPSSLNRMQIWWPSYFGGLHTTAYVALMLGALVYSLSLYDEIRIRYAVISIITISFAVYFGWGVRTATIATLLFICGIAVYQVNRKIVIVLLLAITFVSILATFYFTKIEFEEINYLSSGRLAMYLEKYHQLMGNTILAWIIGNGAGSDLVESEVWWWAEKGAHSDLITILVEGGFVYLFSILAVIVLLYQQGGALCKTLLISAISTSILSNGIFVRPMAGYLFVLAMVLLASYSGTQGRNNASNL